MWFVEKTCYISAIIAAIFLSFGMGSALIASLIHRLSMQGVVVDLIIVSTGWSKKVVNHAPEALRAAALFSGPQKALAVSQIAALLFLLARYRHVSSRRILQIHFLLAFAQQVKNVVPRVTSTPAPPRDRARLCLHACAVLHGPDVFLQLVAGQPAKDPARDDGCPVKGPAHNDPSKPVLGSHADGALRGLPCISAARQDGPLLWDSACLWRPRYMRNLCYLTLCLARGVH